MSDSSIGKALNSCARDPGMDPRVNNPVWLLLIARWLSIRYWPLTVSLNNQKCDSQVKAHKLGSKSMYAWIDFIRRNAQQFYSGPRCRARPAQVFLTLYYWRKVIKLFPLFSLEALQWKPARGRQWLYSFFIPRSRTLALGFEALNKNLACDARFVKTQLWYQLQMNSIQYMNVLKFLLWYVWCL